jgi:hypothetical protein
VVFKDLKVIRATQEAQVCKGRKVIPVIPDQLARQARRVQEVLMELVFHYKVLSPPSVNFLCQETQ